MTEEQIIEYLEHCSTTESCHKDKCPCLKEGHTCIAFESKPVLELVKSQKAEIERLTEMLNATIAGQETLQKALAEKNAEIERLEEQVNLWQEEAGSVGCANEWLRASLKNAHAEAIKEVIEKTQEFLSAKCRGVVEDNPNLDEILYGYRIEDVDEFFDNLVKEMVGDEE